MHECIHGTHALNISHTPANNASEPATHKPQETAPAQPRPPQIPISKVQPTAKNQAPAATANEKAPVKQAVSAPGGAVNLGLAYGSSDEDDDDDESDGDDAAVAAAVAAAAAIVAPAEREPEASETVRFCVCMYVLCVRVCMMRGARWRWWTALSCCSHM